MLRRWSIGLIVAALAALAVAPAALAGPKGTDRPFKATMSGYAHWEFPGDYPSGCVPTVPKAVFGGPGTEGWGDLVAVTTVTESPGNATHMGKIMSYWSHCPTEDKADDGVIKLVDARGYELHGYYDYGEEIDNADGSFTFRKLLIWDGGTGPYADAKGWAVATYGVEPVLCSPSTEICLMGELDLGVEWQWWGTLEGRINM